MLNFRCIDCSALTYGGTRCRPCYARREARLTRISQATAASDAATRRAQTIAAHDRTWYSGATYSGDIFRA